MQKFRNSKFFPHTFLELPIKRDGKRVPFFSQSFLQDLLHLFLGLLDIKTRFPAAFFPPPQATTTAASSLERTQRERNGENERDDEERECERGLLSGGGWLWQRMWNDPNALTKILIFSPNHVSLCAFGATIPPDGPRRRHLRPLLFIRASIGHPGRPKTCAH